MRVYQVPYKYLLRNQLLGQHRELHQMLTILLPVDSRIRGYRNHPEVTRFVGYELSVLVAHEMISNEMASRSYTDYTPINEFIDNNYIFPAPEWPVYTDYASTVRDVVEISKKWITWNESHGWNCWNKGREPMFRNDLRLLSEKELGIDEFIETEKRVYREFSCEYVTALERLMSDHSIEFARLSKEVEVRVLVNSNGLQRGDETHGWVDVRDDRLSPGLIVNPRTGNPSKLAHNEFIIK